MDFAYSAPLLALGLIILGLGVAMLTLFDQKTNDRVRKLEDIHGWGKWHDE
jgi:hypothetical protein